MSGNTVNTVSSFKPPVQILGCSVSEDTCKHMAVMWGVKAIQIAQQDTEEALYVAAVEAAKASGAVKAGDKVVVIAGVPLGQAGATNMVRVIDSLIITIAYK